MSIKQNILFRIYFVFAALLLFAVAILTKAFVIMKVEGNEWLKHTIDITQTKFIDGNRGNVYSTNGHLMATTLPEFNVYMDTRANGLTNELFEDSIATLGKRLNEFDKSLPLYKRRNIDFENSIRAARENSKRYLNLFEELDFVEVAALKEIPFFKLGRNVSGLIIENESSRIYPFEKLARRTIGIDRGEKAEPVGLEGFYSQHLAGVKGLKLMQKISPKKWVSVTSELALKPEDGKDIFTTIDIEIQDIVENELLKGLINIDAFAGNVVVMEVATGKIRAISNLQKTPSGKHYGEIYNNAVGNSFEQGSTFKLASIAALLESGKASLNDKTVVDYGRQKFCNEEMRDVSRLDKGTIPLKEAFKISSNVGIAKKVVNAFKSKPTEYFNLLDKFKLFEQTGISIKGEALPEVVKPNNKRWNNCVTLPWVSIGYSSKLSPLQMLTFYNAVANNGVHVNPILMEPAPKNSKTIAPTTVKTRIIEKETVRQLQHLLYEVVESGTAKNIKSELITQAGKTGTSQFYNEKIGAYEENKYNASFIGYFPAENPKYSISVVINGTTGNVYYGSQIAAPIFKEIAEQIAFIKSELELHKYEILTESSHKISNKAGFAYDHNILSSEIIGKTISPENEVIEMQVLDSAIVAKNFEATSSKVPSVIGMSLKDAIYLLENAGLKVRFKGMGKVSAQSIRKGEAIKQGQTIKLELS